MNRTKSSLVERIHEAAQRCLDDMGSVGILDVYMGVGFLHPSHYQAWQKGLEYAPILDEWIQCGEAKRNKVMTHFLSWTHEQQLESFEVSFEKQARHGTIPLQLTEERDMSLEALYCTRFRRPDITPAQKQRIEQKASKVPDLLVYMPTGKDTTCAECNIAFDGQLLYLEDGKALCLTCADMAHLVFLPRGNATLTRRAKKNSSLSAIVLKFNRRRKRYERQGILVTEAAIDQAEASCAADTDVRARQRERAAARRASMDETLTREMAERILVDFPSCPDEEAFQIALHTAQRGSGRVGRSAAGRALDPEAIHLAVHAWIRHQHTNYDDLLMNGVERLDARQQIRGNLGEKLREWQTPTG